MDAYVTIIVLPPYIMSWKYNQSAIIGNMTTLLIISHEMTTKYTNILRETERDHYSDSPLIHKVTSKPSLIRLEMF